MARAQVIKECDGTRKVDFKFLGSNSNKNIIFKEK